MWHVSLFLLNPVIDKDETSISQQKWPAKFVHWELLGDEKCAEFESNFIWKFQGSNEQAKLYMKEMSVWQKENISNSATSTLMLQDNQSKRPTLLCLECLH